jgi:hypothetical protein
MYMKNIKIDPINIGSMENGKVTETETDLEFILNWWLYIFRIF